MRKTIFGSLKRRGLSVALLVAVGVLGFSAVAAADTVGSIDFESYVVNRRHQPAAGLVEDRPLRRQRRECRPLRLRSGAADLERGHERQLRRPDVLAGSHRSRRGVHCEQAFRRELPDRNDVG